MVKRSAKLPDDAGLQPEENGNGKFHGKGRTQSLPSVLEERTAVGRRELQDEQRKQKTNNAETQGKAHRSPKQDTMISLEEYEAVREILHPGRNQGELDARTEVNTLQLIHFSRGRVMAKRFGIKYLDDYITSIERLSLSLKRKSRLEHVKALSGVMQGDMQASGLLSKLQ